MPRRSIDRSAKGTGKVIDMKTGEIVAKPAIPIVCERIRYYRERAGMEQKALAGKIGITPNAVSNWENGRGRPDLNLVPDICEALQITMYELFGAEEPAGQYTASEQILIGQYRELTPGNRVVAERMMDALLQVQSAERVPRICKLTYYEKALSAGFGDPTEFEGEGRPLYLYASREVDRADCVFSVGGDSMEPRYHDGDMVLVSRIPDAPDLQPGETGAFISGNETYIKIYEKDGLHSLNPAYETMHFDGGNRVYLIGRVTGILDPSLLASEADISKYLLLHPEE